MLMKPYIFEVTRVGAGTLCIMPMPKPNGKRLPESIIFFQRLGIHKIVCLMEADEMHEYGLAQEAALCQQAGIGFVHFPIPDGQLPADVAAFRRLVDELHAELAAGTNMTIHCWAGIGRTGVLAGCILTQAGYAPDTAIQMLTLARGSPVPETMEQYDFIWGFGGNPVPLVI